TDEHEHQKTAPHVAIDRFNQFGKLFQLAPPAYNILYISVHWLTFFTWPFYAGVINAFGNFSICRFAS
ncbi:MAG: hypothetical protein ACOYXC_15790, partial [Candidatus Rifleibacteriota bacterium]